jgi:hypothetical protein
MTLIIDPDRHGSALKLSGLASPGFELATLSHGR